MKRTPMKPGKGLKNRGKPLDRGSSTFKRSGPIQATGKPMASIGQRAKRMRQGKVAPNAEEQAWMDAARSFGCIVCFLRHNAKTPAVIHHILAGGRRMGHMNTIPLCDPGHHQNSPTKEKISRHPNKARFELEYGTEEFLLGQLRRILNGHGTTD